MNEDQLSPMGIETDEAGGGESLQPPEALDNSTTSIEQAAPQERLAESAEISGASEGEAPAATSGLSAAPTFPPPREEEPAKREHPEETKDDEFELAVEAFAGVQTGTTYDDAFRPLKRGELLTATVIQVDTDKAFVDLVRKAEAVIPLEELGSGSIAAASDVVKVGDQIKVVVIQPEAKEGNPVVSKKRAEFHAAWERLLEEFENKQTINAFVVGRVKGGLEVDIGVRGFVPGSHVGSGKLRNLDRFVGQTIPLKIMEVDKERKKVVLSNRLAEQELRQKRKKELFTRVKPGDILEGTVRRLVDYGAFVDLGGLDGLLHVSEMSWSRVDHPSEVLKEGDKVRVMVLRIDAASGRVSLGRRQVLPDPWAAIGDNYSLGQRLRLTVSRVVQSGAFVKLPEGAEAFIPVNEMAHRKLTKPTDVVNPGDEVDVQVIELRPEERRMVLSIRALLPYEEPEMRHRPGQKRRHDRHDRGRGRHQIQDPGGRATIGERLGALRGFIRGIDTGEVAGEESAGVSEPGQDAEPVEQAEGEVKAAVLSQPEVESVGDDQADVPDVVVVTPEETHSTTEEPD